MTLIRIDNVDLLQQWLTGTGSYFGKSVKVIHDLGIIIKQSQDTATVKCKGQCN